MPTPGPVAYQPQPSGLTSAVISRGAAQVLPSSSLEVMNTSSLSRQKGIQIVPVVWSTTGQGLPIVIFASPPSSWINCSALHDAPKSSVFGYGIASFVQT